MVTVTTTSSWCTVLNSPFVIMLQLFSWHFLFFVNFSFVVVAPKHINIYDADVPQMLVDVGWCCLYFSCVVDGGDKWWHSQARPGRIRIKLATVTCPKLYLHHMIHSFIRRCPSNNNEITEGTRTLISMYYCPESPRIWLCWRPFLVFAFMLHAKPIHFSSLMITINYAFSSDRSYAHCSLFH